MILDKKERRFESGYICSRPRRAQFVQDRDQGQTPYSSLLPPLTVLALVIRARVTEVFNKGNFNLFSHPRDLRRLPSLHPDKRSNAQQERIKDLYRHQEIHHRTKTRSQQRGTPPHNIKKKRYNFLLVVTVSHFQCLPLHFT